MRIGIVVNCSKNEAITAAQDLYRWLVDKGVECNMPDYRYGENKNGLTKDDRKALAGIAEKVDLIVAFGGDGTVLSVARTVAPSGKPVFPVNVGGMGFLTEVKVGEVYKAMETILAEQYSIEHRMMLEIELRQLTELSLNEVVIHRGSTPQPAHILIMRQKKSPISFCGDGVIVSTPTGSTAYSLSAGGPVLDPAVCGILCTPICPQARFLRPFVLPPDEELTVEAKIMTGGDMEVFVDGQIALPFKWGEKLVVRRSKTDFSLVRVRGWELFQVLRERMEWMDPREDKV
jgi:NAD+ kinase